MCLALADSQRCPPPNTPPPKHVRNSDRLFEIPGCPMKSSSESLSAGRIPRQDYELMYAPMPVADLYHFSQSDQERAPGDYNNAALVNSNLYVA